MCYVYFQPWYMYKVHVRVINIIELGGHAVSECMELASYCYESIVWLKKDP